MTSFNRTFSPQELDTLARMAIAGDNWWADLLAAWGPSGSPEGLRLGLRNGSLNFYSAGQSVGKVSFSGGKPWLEIHWKYVSEHQPGRRPYIRIPADGGFHRTDGACAWGGKKMLAHWIAGASEHHDPEKTGVERVVAANSSVVDLEAAVPKDGVRPSQLRMDLVALERDGSTIRVVFWEAKCVDGGKGELRSHTGEPKVLVRQIRDYEAFLTENAARVAEAYRRACALTLTLHAIAGPGKPALDPLIHEAAHPDSRLEVDPVPRLVLFDEGKPRREKDWLPHLARLQAKTTVVVCPVEGPYSLSPMKAAA